MSEKYKQSENNLKIYYMESVYKKDGTLINLLQDVDIESGTNYIKFPSGTLICFGSFVINVEFIKEGNMNISRTSTNQQFPIQFIETPSLSLLAVSSGAIYRCEYDRNKIFNIIMFSNNTATSESIIKYIAIGRWK